MKLKSLVVLVLVLGFASISSAQLLKVDLSCPDDSSTKAGGDWVDFEWIGGCDGQKHDPRSLSTEWLGMNISFTAGDPGGKSNLFKESGDALHNTRLCHPEGFLRRNHFKVTGLAPGTYDFTIDGEDAPSSATINSTGAGNTYTIFDTTAGLDNFTMTPEPATVALLGLGSVALLRKRREK